MLLSYLPLHSASSREEGRDVEGGERGDQAGLGHGVVVEMQPAVWPHSASWRWGRFNQRLCLNDHPGCYFGNWWCLQVSGVVEVQAPSWAAGECSSIWEPVKSGRSAEWPSWRANRAYRWRDEALAAVWRWFDDSICQFAAFFGIKRQTELVKNQCSVQSVESSSVEAGRWPMQTGRIFSFCGGSRGGSQGGKGGKENLQSSWTSW